MKKVLIFTMVIALTATTVIFASPGDTSDPIVVLSYLNQRIESLIDDYKLEEIEEIKTQIDELENGTSSSKEGTTASLSLDIVEIHEGEKIIAKEGTELILRGGEAFIIGSELGGITNITLGKDFVSDMMVPANHLLIVPRDDGRGVYTNDYAIFMVRGEYEVIDN